MTLHLIAPPSLSGAATWPVVVGGGALYCDAWTSLGRLYGAAVGLILLVDGRGGGGGGGGGFRAEGLRGAKRAAGRPPHGSLRRRSRSQALSWRVVHNTLFSPLHPFETCHTHVMDGERKTVKKGKRGRGRTKKQLLFAFFSL